MRTITALFDTYDHAASAVRSLRDAGIDSADVSIVANNVAGDIQSGDDMDAEERTRSRFPASMMWRAHGFPPARE